MPSSSRTLHKSLHSRPYIGRSSYLSHVHDLHLSDLSTAVSASECQTLHSICSCLQHTFRARTVVHVNKLYSFLKCFTFALGREHVGYLLHVHVCKRFYHNDCV